MSVASSTAIAIGVGAASAGASVYGAKKSADAAKQAAATQSASGDRALAIQQQMYEQQQLNLAPYRTLGQGSLQNLGNFQSFAGVPGNFGAGVNKSYQHALSPNFQMPSQAPAGQPPVDQAIPRMAAPGGFVGRVRQATGTLADPSGAAPDAQLVRMRAPDGEVRAVPQAMVPQLMGMGAQVVG